MRRIQVAHGAAEKDVFFPSARGKWGVELTDGGLGLRARQTSAYFDCWATQAVRGQAGNRQYYGWHFYFQR